MTDHRIRKSILIIINIVLILSAVVFSWFYSTNLQRQQTKAELGAFCATIESMKQVSENYLRMEQGYAKDWAKYINSHEMTMDEALAYINETNNQADRQAHIVDMDTFEAYSTNSGRGNEVNCYKRFYEEKTQTDEIFIRNMKRMYLVDDDFSILGKYRTDDTQANVISVGTSVTLRTGALGKKSYLLLRLIPVESIRSVWVFPVEYDKAEVGMITRSGAYVIPSKSMKSQSFSEFVLGYNYKTEYKRVDDLLTQLSTTDRGVLEYKNSKDEACYWYYSCFKNNNDIDILGYIPVKELDSGELNWTIVIATSGILFLLTLLDGAHILHMNRELKEAAELAGAASRAKTQFLSAMSHDIRTPMNGIIGMTDIAKKHLEDADYVGECLDKVSLASDHLLTLINDVLDISKVESGKMALNPTAFSLEQSLDKLIDMIRLQVEEKEISFELKKDIPQQYIVADELRMNQIYMNILTNAIKYTPKGGSIRLSVTETLLENDRIQVVYRVADTGIGMSEEFQKDMYHMFTRELDDKPQMIQGTGLGLAIVKQLVDLMQGTITCESALDQGTTFTVTLELMQASRKQQESIAGTDETAGESVFDGLKVLVAEDNELNWEVVHELLNGLHVESDWVHNGKECIEAVEASADGIYDMILMDIQMPVMNGREAARQLRLSERAYVRNMMIVAMTADAFAEDVQACLDAGMDAHLSKPVDIRRVREILRKVKRL